MVWRAARCTWEGAFIVTDRLASYLVLLLLPPTVDRAYSALAPYRTEAAIMGLFVPLGLCIHFFQQSLRGSQAIRQVVRGSPVLQLTAKFRLCPSTA